MKAKVVQDERLIVVKFTRRYNRIAHNLCARSQYAPPLLYFGDSAELGGFYVVVMAYVPHQPLIPEEIHSLATRKNIYKDVQSAVTLLHSQRLVFADLRNPNIPVVTRNGAQRAMLIDFDWCEIDGTGVYPLPLSRTIRWPDGVEPGGFFRKAHDLHWLKVLWKSLNLKHGMTFLYIALSAS